MLNANQKRTLGITLGIMEEELGRLRRLILQGEETGLFFHITDDLRSEEKRFLQERIDLLMDYLVSLKTFFDLGQSTKELDLRGIVKATALYLSVNLEGSVSARLKGYGDVAPGLEELLDPKLKEMISLLGEMETMEKSSRRIST